MALSATAKRLAKNTKGPVVFGGSTSGYSVRLPSEADIAPSVPQLNFREKVLTAAAQPFQRTAKGIVASAGGYDTLDKQTERGTTVATQNYTDALRLYKQGKVSKRYLESTKGDFEKAIAASQSRVKETLDVTNKRKFVGAAYEVGLTPFLLSPSGLAVKANSAGKLVKAATLPTKSLKRVALEEAISGGVSSIPSIAQQDKITPGSVAKDITLNTALGLGGALVGPAGKQVTTASNRVIKGGVKAITEPLSKTPVGKSLGRVFTEAQSRVQNDLIKLRQVVGDEVDKAYNMKKSDVIEQLAFDVRQSGAKWEALKAENAALIKLQGIVKSREQLEQLGKFISAKQTAINLNKVNKKKVAIPVGTAEQETAYKLLNEATKPVIEFARAHKLIDEATYKKWLADPDYTRVQRLVEKIDQRSVGTRPEASLTTSITKQKLKGSTKEAVNPFVSFEDWGRKITTEGLRNKASTYLFDNLKDQGFKVARSAESVTKRRELAKQIVANKAARKPLEAAAKDLKSAVKDLNKKLASKKSGVEAAVASNLKLNAKKLTTPEGFAKFVEDVLEAGGNLGGTAKQRNASQRLYNAIEELSDTNSDIKFFKDTLDDTVARITSNKAVNNKLFKEIRSLADIKTTNKPTISRITNGIKEVVAVTPDIEAAVKRFDPIHLGTVEKILMFPTRLLRAGATSLNPAFAISNLPADFVTSAIFNPRARGAQGSASVIFQSLKDTAKGYAKEVAPNAAGKLKISDEFRRYLSNNAHITSVDLTRDLRKAVDQVATEYGVGGKKLSGGVRKLEDAIGTSETVTRYQNWLSGYRKAIDEGLSEEAALLRGSYASREYTVNFGRQGEWAKAFRMINPYLNPAIQGSALFARSIAERPTQTILKTGALLGVPVAASTYYNLSDPERAVAYANIPDYEKENNLILVTKWGDGKIGYVRFKLPPGLKSVMKPLRNLVEAEFIGDRQGFAETAKNLFIDPINPLGGTVREVVSSVTPQGVKPLVQASLNKDLFTGRDIVPGNLQGLPPEEQVFSGTPSIYRDIGRALNVSPLQVQQAVRGTTAGGGEALFAAIDQARRAAGADVIVGNRSLPAQLKGRYTRDVTTSQGSSDFYTAYSKARSLQAARNRQISDASKEGDFNKAKQIAQRYQTELEKAFAKFDRKYRNGGLLLEKDKQKFQELRSALKINSDDKSLKRRAKR